MPQLKPITDTTEIFQIDYGDIVRVGERCYKVTGHAREVRFGLDEPKFWVKRVVDLESGEKKLMKLSYLEDFNTKIGPVSIRCFRNPAKEAEILDLVKNHPQFMQGVSYKDDRDNVIRILDIIHGPNFFNYIDGLKYKYEDYFEKALPVILKKLVRCFEAIRFLHLSGYRHGDIRNDHILVERETANFIWIDFDYDFDTSENPYGLDILGIGNILIYAIGMGFHTLHLIASDPVAYQRLSGNLESYDFSIIHKSRLVNLAKLYPCIPQPLNDVLLHFSQGASVYYETVDEVIEDVNRCIYMLQ
jgi:hypothetical protein